MEKITYQPLIELLRENAESLNQLLKSFINGSGRLNTEAVPDWFKEVIEPVFIAVHQHNPALSRRVFDALYNDMLQTLSSAAGHQATQQLRSCRLLLVQNPALTAANPGRLIKTLSVATLRISRHSIAAAEKWLALMQKIFAAAGSIDQLLLAARFAAWRCGMAHLRHLTGSLSTLEPRLRDLIFAEEKISEDDLRRSWKNEADAKPFALGAFKGLQGKFVRPPRVFLDNNLVFAADGRYSAVIFADRYGALLHDAPEIPEESIPNVLKSADMAPPAAAKILSRYPDLTSWVYHDTTLFLTTASSHAIFIFGAIND
mgnify:CR=1 FL=1